jgi:hypothetical protein
VADSNDPIVKLTAHEDAVWQDGSNEPIRQAIFTNWPVNERGEFDENGKLLTEAELRQNGNRLLGRGENEYGITHHIEVIPPLHLDNLERLFIDPDFTANMTELLARVAALEGEVSDLQAYDLIQDAEITALQTLTNSQQTTIINLQSSVDDLLSRMTIMEQTALTVPSARAKFASVGAMIFATRQYLTMRPSFAGAVTLNALMGKVYSDGATLGGSVGFQQDAIRRPPFIFGAAAFNGASSMLVAGKNVLNTGADLDATGSVLGITSQQLMRALSKLSVVGSFSGDTGQIKLWQAAALLQPEGFINVGIGQLALASSRMNATGALFGDLIRMKDGAALLAASGSLLATARLVKYGNALLAASGTFASAATTLSASTWSPTDQQFTTLSSGNTIMNSNSVPPDIAVCRGTAGRGPGSGKRYFTMQIGRGLASKDHQGLGVATLSYGVFNGEVGINTGSWSIISNGGGAAYQLQNQGASVINTSVNYSSSDVVNVAFDAATGNLWFGVNGTYFNSTGASTGNPGAGTNPTFNVSTNTIYPIGAAYSSADNILLTTNPTSGAPSGFTNWG